ncbi:ElaB/YgaM/YqjD family protein [Acidisoma sp. 7E03]
MTDFEAETAGQTNRIAEDIAALKQDVAALIRQMKDLAVREASRVSQDAADTISERAADLYDTVSDTGRRSADRISAHVEEQPVTSLLLAFAAGFIVSKILTR